MATLFGVTFDPAVSLLMEQFAERGADGSYKLIRYFDPTRPAGSPDAEWPVILSDSRSEPVFDEATQQTTVKQTRLAEVPTKLVEASGVSGLQPDATFEWDGLMWAIDEATSAWDSEFVTFGLIREPLTRMNELRRAPV